MTTRYFLLIMTLICSAFGSAVSASTKQERNYIVQGNELYNQKRFAEAEAMYKKALTVSPASEVAKFNLASALIRQAGSADANKGNTPLEDAAKLLTELAENAKLASIAEKASYDLGNISFNAQQYQQAIEHYKNSLRKNPDNDKARENLRLAQKKLQEQQNQDKNQDKDQNKDQNKEDKKDQQQQQQQQDQKQNQDQNKDKQDQKDQPQEKKENKNQQPPQTSGGISDENANKILKAMENAEAATRKKVEARKQRSENSRRRQVTRPW